MIYSPIFDFSQLLMLMVQSLRKHFSSTREQIIMVMIIESGSRFSCATLNKLLSFFFLSKVSYLKNGDCIFIIISMSSSDNWANIHDVLREATTTKENIYKPWLLLLLLFMKKGSRSFWLAKVLWLIATWKYISRLLSLWNMIFSNTKQRSPKIRYRNKFQWNSQMWPHISGPHLWVIFVAYLGIEYFWIEMKKKCVGRKWEVGRTVRRSEMKLWLGCKINIKIYNKHKIDIK